MWGALCFLVASPIVFLLIPGLFCYSGLYLMRRREYVVGGGFFGPRDSSSQRVKYRLIGDGAVLMGKAYIIGGALIGISFILPLPLWFVTRSQNCVGTFAGLTCLVGWGVVFLGDIITWYTGDWRKIEDNEQA